MLRLFGRINFRGFIASIPILIAIYYTLNNIGVVSYVYVLAFILLLLGLYFNKYTFIASLIVLGYLTSISSSIGVYGLITWLIGIICAKTTNFIDIVISFAVIAGGLSLTTNLGLMEIILLAPLSVYILGLTGVDLIHSPRLLSLSLLLISITIVIAKATSSNIVLDVYAVSTIVSILLLENITKESTMEEVS